ncbi:MAG: hypothetical protein KFKLKKLM_00590 [Flavobacteriales bacterium]|nr:hypothetical protein [Flavobacteriales bacterium]
MFPKSQSQLVIVPDETVELSVKLLAIPKQVSVKEYSAFGIGKIVIGLVMVSLQPSVVVTINSTV